jgi:hypothetical protein
MADTFTAVLNLTKPEVGASTDTWGTKVNADLDTIDRLFDAGPVLKLSKGGTGAATASGARTNLGVAIGTDVQAYSAATASYASTGIGFRNRIINGDMRIDQRNAGASVTITNTSQITYTLDRFNAYGTVASKFSVQQNAGAVTPPAGFTNYLGVTSLSAYAITSTDRFVVQYRGEGYNTADLAWGTASAVPVTVSFWVRSSIAGSFGGSLMNGSVNRSYPFLYSVSTPNTWELKTITVPGDTTGTWGTGNGEGIRLTFGLGNGSTESAAAGSWVSGFFLSATGATSVVGTSGATFYITGVQLEAGTVATPFERRDYGRELMMCERYFEFCYAGWRGQGYGAIGAAGVNFRVQKRVSPTITLVAKHSSENTAGDPYPHSGTLNGFQARCDVNTAGSWASTFKAECEL